jgi:hypothetical protein
MAEPSNFPDRAPFDHPHSYSLSLLVIAPVGEVTIRVGGGPKKSHRLPHQNRSRWRRRRCRPAHRQAAQGHPPLNSRWRSPSLPPRDRTILRRRPGLDGRADERSFLRRFRTAVRSQNRSLSCCEGPVPKLLYQSRVTPNLSNAVSLLTSLRFHSISPHAQSSSSGCGSKNAARSRSAPSSRRACAAQPSSALQAPQPSDLARALP